MRSRLAIKRIQEKKGLLGSKDYAKSVREGNIDLYRLVNLDMIGYPQMNPGIIIIERDNNPDPLHNEVVENDQPSIEFGEIMKEISAYTDLQFHLDSIYDSDYEPFEAEGYVVIGELTMVQQTQPIHIITAHLTCRH